MLEQDTSLFGGGPEILHKVVRFCPGDRIEHQETGRTHVVSYVRVSGYTLFLATERGEFIPAAKARKLEAASADYVEKQAAPSLDIESAWGADAVRVF